MASKMVDLQPVNDIGLDTDGIKKSMLDRKVYITSLENWDIFNMPVGSLILLPKMIPLTCLLSVFFFFFFFYFFLKMYA